MLRSNESKTTFVVGAIIMIMGCIGVGEILGNLELTRDTHAILGGFILMAIAMNGRR